jgi:hypothetical protein
VSNAKDAIEKFSSQTAPLQASGSMKIYGSEMLISSPKVR